MTAGCAALLAACGPVDTVYGTSSGNAAIRVIHGSPDAGSIDVRLDSNTGSALVAGASYGKVGTYQSVAAGTHSIYINPAGSTSTTTTCASTTYSPSQNYTVVIAGKKSQGVNDTTLGLQCQVIAEPTFDTSSGDYTLSVHNASPAGNALGGTFSYGTFPPGTTSYSAPVGVTPQLGVAVSALGIGSYGLYIAQGVTTAPGIGFWVAPQSSVAPTSVLDTILPSQGVTGSSGSSGSADTNNFLPFSTTVVNFSLYFVDGPDGASGAATLPNCGASASVCIIGAFD
jgi:hypothetical protein